MKNNLTIFGLPEVNGEDIGPRVDAVYESMVIFDWGPSIPQSMFIVYSKYIIHNHRYHIE